MADAAQVVEAEKGKNLSPRNLHLRLRVVEIVLLVSLALNLLHWYVGEKNEDQIRTRVDAVQQQGEAR